MTRAAPDARLLQMPRLRPAFPAATMLTHFTRAQGGATALDNLVKILREGVIRGATRMIRGRRPAVCLCAAPVTELSRLLVHANRRRYQPFGLALDKGYAFGQGARPVIYLPWSEAGKLLAAGEWWRVAVIDLERRPPVDWSYEREWRIAGDLALPPGGPVALVENWRDVDEIYERFDGRPPCTGVIPLRDLFGYD